MIKPEHIIKINKQTGKIESPTLLLQTRSRHTIGKISHYKNWNCSLVGNGIDEFTFDVHKYHNGILCKVWDDLVDLKVIEILDYGRFEIQVSYADSAETIKSVHGFSLEIELGQIFLNNFHVNDEEATSIEKNEFNIDEFDANGNIIPTVFYNASDQKHSLLHRVIADKAPHWSLGYITPYIVLDEESQPELSNKFQRTYTVDGESVYDFLTGKVAVECNVIFLFDTLNRVIHCYSLCDCIDQNTGNILESGIGSDTSIIVSKKKLTNEISISSNKDSVKNCFRIKGGDDTISDLVRAVNVNGSNYIYQFADFQYKDMSDELVEKLKSYTELVKTKSDEYYGENGIYTKICNTYEDYLYYKSEMMPNVVISSTTAHEQYNILVSELSNITIGVSSVNNFTGTAFIGVTNNVESIAQTLIDSRYTVSVIKDSTSYDTINYIWSGKFEIYRNIDETDKYTGTTSISITVTDDELEFTKQKIKKSLEKGEMLNVDLDISESPYVNTDGSLNTDKIQEYFNLYCLERLKSYKAGYESCLSILMTMGMGTENDDEETSAYYKKYYDLKNIVEKIYIEREKQVNDLNQELNELYIQQAEFQKEMDFQSYLGQDLYLEFCSYRREDTYSNENYISEGLTHLESMEKAKELVEVATKELKKACVLQRVVSCPLNNLFALKEFEPLYSGFSLFNYIRIKTEDEIIKLRLLGVDFSGNDITTIVVTFSEQIECIDGKTKDVQSILKQANNIATSYTATTLQAKQGVTANEGFSEIIQNGLNTSKSILYNNDNNEVTMSGAGIICKKMDDERIFSNKQLRIVGNGMYMTNDAWQSVELAIGEIEITQPDGTRQRNYGLIADKIIGNMIIGNSLLMENTSGNVKITGDGINITGGSISLKAFANDAKNVITDAQNTANDAKDMAQEALSNTITNVDIMYALSTSSITAPTSNWNTVAPQWVDGSYMWQKTVTTYSDGHKTESEPTCITGASGNNGIGITSIVEQYYLSSSNIIQNGGSWSTTQPSWKTGYYLWTRSYITWDDGTTTTSDPVLSGAINSANENAYDAKLWTDENGVPLYQMIDTWVGDSKISGTTLMQGGFIQTNTISVEHIIPKKYDDNISFINLQNGTFNFGNKLTWDNDSLIVKGTIYATSGEFTGDIKSGSTITCGDKFYVDADGKLKAVDGEFSGTISSSVINCGDNFSVTNTGEMNAKAGYIGGWTIGEKSLYNQTNALSSTIQGIYLGTDGFLNYNAENKYVKIAQGQIIANSGNIGGFTMDNQMLYSYILEEVDNPETELQEVYEFIEIDAKNASIKTGIGTQMVEEGLMGYASLEKDTVSASYGLFNVITLLGDSDTLTGIISGDSCFFENGTFNKDLYIGNKVTINHSGDADGTYLRNPSLTIGDSYGQHLEFDNNEIMAKSDDCTPSSLLINRQGGAVVFNQEVVRFAISTEDYVTNMRSEGNILIRANESSFTDEEGTEYVNQGRITLRSAGFHDDPDIYSNGSIRFQDTYATNLGAFEFDATSAYFSSKAIYNRTTSDGYAVHIDSSGILSRFSSASKYKVDIQSITDDKYAYNILKLNPKTWYDKSKVESYTRAINAIGENKDPEEVYGSFKSTEIQRVHGMVAEDVEKAGLKEYCEYSINTEDNTKELEGLSYDKLTTLLIPIMRDVVMTLQEVVPVVKEHIQDENIIKKLTKLQDKFDSFKESDVIQ